MALSKDQALAAAIRHQCEEMLAALSTARGRLKVIDVAVMDLLHDAVTRQDSMTTVALISDAIDEAGTQTRGLLDRMTHVEQALRS